MTWNLPALLFPPVHFHHSLRMGNLEDLFRSPQNMQLSWISRMNTSYPTVIQRGAVRHMKCHFCVLEQSMILDKLPPLQNGMAGKVLPLEHLPRPAYVMKL